MPRRRCITLELAAGSSLREARWAFEVSESRRRNEEAVCIFVSPQIAVTVSGFACGGTRDRLWHQFQERVQSLA